MLNELSFSLAVLRPGGAVERLVIPSGRILVGAGAHCDIRIDGAGAAREHVELELEGEHIVARARAHSPPPLIGGQPLVASKLQPDTTIAVCGTRITVNVMRDTSANAAQSPARKLAMTLAVVLSTIVLPIAVYLALMPTGEEQLGPPPKAAALWPAPVVTCKVAAKDQALFLAKNTHQQAEANRERAPYAVEDGVTAVTAFETAAACYRVAGRNEEANLAEEAAHAMRVLVERDYASRRLRLELALEHEDALRAMREVRVLRKLTSGAKSPYADWLAMVDRRLEVNARTAKAKAQNAAKNSL